MISGTATEQATGDWFWMLRYPDGEFVGEGRAPSWTSVLGGIRQALVQETKYGRLGYLRPNTTS